MPGQQPYQSSLFDLPVRQEPAVVLDIKQARKLRDGGVEKAEEHAEREWTDWKEKAYEFLKYFLDNHNGPFMAEEVRSLAAYQDFPLPPSARAWGGIIIRAAKEGLIVRMGIQKVKNKKAHCANAAVWMASNKG